MRDLGMIETFRNDGRYSGVTQSKDTLTLTFSLEGRGEE